MTTAPRSTLVHLPSATLVALHRTLAQDHSAADAAALVRQIGFQSGEAFLAAFEEWLQQVEQTTYSDATALGSEEFWPRLSGFFSSLGWGPLHFEQLHPGVASLSSPEWAEAEPEGDSRQPTCHFTTGLLSDLLGRVAGQDLAVMEVECRSRGDLQCRFVFGSAETMGGVFEQLRGGRSVGDALEQLV